MKSRHTILSLAVGLGLALGISGVAQAGCTGAEPVITVSTIAKGQSSQNNMKVVHAITGQILGYSNGEYAGTLHRVKVCSGSPVTVMVLDRSGGAGELQVTGQSGGDFCSTMDSSQASCQIFALNSKFKYTVKSADGKDTDSITLLPQ